MKNDRMQLNYLSNTVFYIRTRKRKDTVRTNTLSKQRTRSNSLMQSNPYICNNFSYNSLGLCKMRHLLEVLLCAD